MPLLTEKEEVERKKMINPFLRKVEFEWGLEGEGQVSEEKS